MRLSLLRLFSLLSLASLASLAAASAQQPSWTARFDEAWTRRDQPAALKEIGALIKAQIASDPDSFETNWRLAQVYVWEANGADGDHQADLGQAGWEAGDKAILAKPDDVRGHYLASTGLGLYSEGIGILRALSKGVEGKFRDRIQAALRIDKDYLDGAPQVVWGRYFYKLPWPKRDIGESIKVLTAAVQGHPKNLRAKLYLADSLLEAEKGAEAKKLMQEVVAAPAGDDLPEEKRIKDQAKKWLSEH